MHRTAKLIALILAFPAVLLAQSAGEVHKALTTEAQHLANFEKDVALLDFVKAQNAKRVPLSEIQRIDREWTAGDAAAVVQAVTAGACADYLRKTFGAHDHYAEVFLMDDQGALVCANQKTSDYWQGDEDKWSRSFNNGTGTAFIDRPRFDESSKTNMSAISIPLLDGAKTVGVLMIGVKVDKLLAK